MTKTIRRSTIVRAVACILLAAACGGEDDVLPPPEAEKLVDKDDVTGTVDFYAPNDGKRVLAAGANAEQAALDWLEANKAVLGIPNPKEAFKPIATTTDDEDKTTSVKLEQRAGGLPVWGVESVVHFDEDGAVSAFDGPYVPNLDAIAKQPPKTDEATALRNAEAEIRTLLAGTLPMTLTPVVQELVVHVEDDNSAPALARHVRLRAQSDAMTVGAEAFVDALDGHVIDAWVDAPLAEVSAVGLDGETHRINVAGPFEDGKWQMGRDQGEGGPSFGLMVPGNWIGPRNGRWRDILASSKDGPWDRHAVSAMFNARRTEQFYVDNFKWFGPNGRGNPLLLGLHFANGGEWNAFAFSSDDGQADMINFTDRHQGLESGVVALDLVGHEFTHLVTAYNSKLPYRRQPGAINEALSDIFGALLERSVDGANDNVFLFAEDIGKHLRDMRHPKSTGETKFGLQVDNFGELKVLPRGERPHPRRNDSGFIHHNSSIVSNAWALQVEGGVHDTTKVVVANKTGWDKSVRLWWKTQRQLLTRRSTIRRLARTQTVAALYSRGRFDVRAVACSWLAVGALPTHWIEQKLRIRCDTATSDATAGPRAPRESCEGKADGVYCSTTAKDVGYICKVGHITVIRCNEGLHCTGAVPEVQIPLVNCAE